MKTDYVVRKAAGDWWLVDVAQTGEPYRKPRRINHTAAEIIRMLQGGKTEEETVRYLHERYGAPLEEAASDVEALVQQLGEE